MGKLPIEKYDKMPRIIIRGSSYREFSISANGSGKIWIETEDGEGGEFREDLFAEYVKSFFNNFF